MSIPHRSIVAAYSRLENGLSDFLRAIPLESAHLQVWSPILATTILEAGSQLDSLWKMQLRADETASDRADIAKYFKTFGKQVAGRWLVVWSDDGQKIVPFAEWHQATKYTRLPWWQAYNELKHDRWMNKRNATIRNAILAVGGVFLAIIHCPMMGEALKESGWLHTNYNPDAVTEKINNDAEVAGMGAAFETPLLSYALAYGSGRVSVSVYYRASHKLVNWLREDFRHPAPTI